MLTRGRVLLLVAVLALVAVLFTAWQVWRVQQDLTAAEADVRDLRSAIQQRDDAAREEATESLRTHAADADAHSNGWWLSALSYLPFVGDDIEGVQVLSAALSDVAENGIEPLSQTLTSLDGISADGAVDLEAVQGLQEPVAQARASFSDAAENVGALDSDGFVGPLRTRFDEADEQLQAAAVGLASAETATAVLPDMLGADGPRDYFLIFQNKAELRATGGLPGSWAHLRADAGTVSIEEQGTAADFPQADRPVLPLTAEEKEVYGKEMGTYFQNPGFTPDFPRAAELFRAHWDLRFPDTEIDGVFALDQVALSYLLEGTGPVEVGDLTLTAENVVEELLNKPYLELEPAEQDALFEEAARSIFDRATGDLASPTAFVQGLTRATREGRFLVAPFAEADAAELEGSQVLGAMPEDDGETPFVDVGLNDTTGSKMSYYLRVNADVEATACNDGRQEIDGTMSLQQDIDPAEAVELPNSVTGPGTFGTERGSQLISVRLYGPHGGSIDSVMLDGKKLEPDQVGEIGGRPVTTVVVLLETTDDLVLNWSMTVGEGQRGDGEFASTPLIGRGTRGGIFESACG